MGHKPPICLGTTIMLGYKQAQTVYGSMAPFANGSFTSFWRMEVAFYVKQSEITE